MSTTNREIYTCSCNIIPSPTLYQVTMPWQTDGCATVPQFCSSPANVAFSNKQQIHPLPIYIYFFNTVLESIKQKVYRQSMCAICSAPHIHDLHLIVSLIHVHVPLLTQSTVLTNIFPFLGLSLYPIAHNSV